MSNPHRGGVHSNRASWQLPAGVSRGTWDYVTQPAIANEYDRFHAGHPLLALDTELIAQQLGPSPYRTDGARRIAVDFGCGTGRNLMPLAEQGWRVIGVDLSLDMLGEFQAKAKDQMHVQPVAVLANMADLRCLAGGFADAVLCMYSSLGMVQGRKHRRSFMNNASRILNEEGKFFVHVHNRGSWLRDPGGIRRTLVDWCRAWRDANWELGDSVYAYRGLPSMFLHIYSERELRQDLNACGLNILRFYRLNRQSSGLLQGNWLTHLRSGGFLAVCSRRKVLPKPEGFAEAM
jgi:SAM-dependent methyltransferase